MKDCEACGKKFELLKGRGANNRVTCYECTSGDYKISWRNKHVKRAYGMTLFQVRTMFDNQNGECAICLREMTFENVDTKRGERREKAGVCIDHCHQTGRVRGLLCFGCNTALGHMLDDVEAMKRMVHYALDGS